MTDKFFGIWFPGEGWWRITRSVDQKAVPWATTERGFARAKARELGGHIKRIDEALGEPAAQERMLKAEQSAKGKAKLWHKIITRLYHPAI